MLHDTFRWALLCGGFHGAVAVAMGAFAAHALAARLDARALELVETGARYQLIHAAALVAVALLAKMQPELAGVRVSAAAFAFGAAIFAGTLYAIALGGPKWFGAITPIGGTLLIAGWAALAVSAWRSAT